MFSFKYIFVFICLTLAVNGENIKSCPRFCNCDSYLLLNRAQCSSKHLVSAEVDIPYQVQILDLSYNDITIVDKYCFKHFSHLKYFNISNNALHTLELEAFSKLFSLIELDLSNNRLEYLDESLFTKNKLLFKINLEGNKFMSLSPQILIKNAHLKVLNLRNSQINLLHSEMFAGVPNLEELDLSKNLLNNFNLEDFKHLAKLKTLNLNANFIKCDKNIQEKLRKLEYRDVNASLDSCLPKNSIKFQSDSMHKFEKMIFVSSDMEQEEDAYSQNDIKQWHLDFDSAEEEISKEYDEMEFNFDKRNFNFKKASDWLQFSPDNIVCANNYPLCEKYRACLQDLNKAWHANRIRSEQFPSNDIIFAFFLGLAVGVATVVIILFGALCLKGCVRQRRQDITLEDIPSQPMARPLGQLPPNVRRQPRRRVARPIVRYEGPVAENFLSRLFGRPARQQYYRSINQNTATLIRRLSRSNLFNNRLSQHFMDRQTSNENRGNSEGLEDASFIPSAPRAETPPPAYGDIVINNCGQGK